MNKIFFKKNCFFNICLFFCFYSNIFSGFKINDSFINEIKNDIKTEVDFNTKQYVFLIDKNNLTEKIFNSYDLNYDDSSVYNSIENEIFSLWAVIKKYLKILDVIAPKDDYEVYQDAETSSERDYHLTGGELLEDIFLGSDNFSNKRKFITKSNKKVIRKKYNVYEVINDTSTEYIIPKEEKDILVLAIKVAIRKIYSLIMDTNYKLKIFIDKNYRLGNISFFKYYFNYNLQDTLSYYVLPTVFVGAVAGSLISQYYARTRYI
jgi:hypothetical protein